MSRLLPLSKSTLATVRLVGTSQPVRRTFSSSAAMLHKETHSQNPDVNDHLDKHKTDSLHKQASGQGAWKPELASDSEEAIRYEKEANGGLKSAEDIKKLQERTKGNADSST